MRRAGAGSPSPCIGRWVPASETCDALCGERGTRKEVFEVLQAETNGGLGCDAEDGEERVVECEAPPCPVNCEGAWIFKRECGEASGSDDSNTEAETTLLAQFKVDIPAAHGGDSCEAEDGELREEPCSPPVRHDPFDCRGEWRDVEPVPEAEGGAEGGAEGANASASNVFVPSVCRMTGCNADGTKITGKKTQTFFVTSGAAFGGKDCPVENQQTREVSCQQEEPCPVNCEGRWVQTTGCDARCGPGKLVETYQVDREPLRGGECPLQGTTRHRNCVVAEGDCDVDCSGKWVVDEPCRQDCTQWERYTITREARKQGIRCPHSHDDRRKVKCGVCPVNCEGRWVDDTPCNAACERTGTRRQRFEVTVPAAHNGTPCDHAHGSTRIVSCHNATLCWRDWADETLSSGGEVSVSESAGIAYKTHRISSNAIITIGNYPLTTSRRWPEVLVMVGLGAYATLTNVEPGSYMVWAFDPNTGTAGIMGPGVNLAVPNPAEAPINLRLRLGPSYAWKSDCVPPEEEWEPCSSPCRDIAGTQTRNPIVHPAIGGGARCGTTTGSRPCTTDIPCPVNCEYSWIDNWSACTGPCGITTGTKTRHPVISKQSAHGGTECPGPQTEQCTTKPCPVHCEYSWIDNWSACEGPCGITTGTKTRHPVISKQSAHGGRECPGPQTELCTTEPCPPIHCSATVSDWGPCDGLCGGNSGLQTRSITIHTQPQYGGTLCPTGTVQPCTNTTNCDSGVIGINNESHAANGFKCPGNNHVYEMRIARTLNHGIKGLMALCYGDQSGPHLVGSWWPESAAYNIATSYTGFSTVGAQYNSTHITKIRFDEQWYGGNQTNTGNEAAYTCPSGKKISGISARAQDGDGYMSSIQVSCT